jgi:hypothetical protein
VGSACGPTRWSFDAVHDVAQQAFAENVAVWLFEPTEAFLKEKLATRWGHLEGFEDHVGITAFRFTHHYLTGGWVWRTRRRLRPDTGRRSSHLSPRSGGRRDHLPRIAPVKKRRALRES